MKSMELDLAIIGGSCGPGGGCGGEAFADDDSSDEGEPGEVFSGDDFRAGSQTEPTGVHAGDGWAQRETADSVRRGDRLEPAPIGTGPDSIRTLLSSEIRTFGKCQF